MELDQLKPGHGGAQLTSGVVADWSDGLVTLTRTGLDSGGRTMYVVVVVSQASWRYAGPDDCIWHGAQQSSVGASGSRITILDTIPSMVVQRSVARFVRFDEG